jgi:anti-sigma factor RsiW
MANCKFEILVSAYLDHELSAEERDLFEQHVASCDTCRALIAEWKEVEAALRRQQLREALRHESNVADSVRRELSRSGEFRRARQKSAWRRLREAVGRHWRLGATAAVVVIVALVFMAIVGDWSTPPNPGPSNSRAEERLPADPPLERIVAHAEGLLTELVAGAGHRPGLGRRIRTAIGDADLLTRLAYDRTCRVADEQVRERLLRLETVLTLLANMPEEQADAEAALVADALKRSELLRELKHLRQRLALRPY